MSGPPAGGSPEGGEGGLAGPEEHGPPAPTLLAVDLGLRTGYALFDHRGRLVWYRSRNYGSRERLRRAVQHVLSEAGAGLRCVVLEGTPALAEIWAREALRRGLSIWLVRAETWRQRLLLQRQQRHAGQAKHQAGLLARRIIAWSRARRPVSLRHDAAEAICIGLWGVLELGWLESMPALE